jgi:uncharacterized membrane protein YjgN (DUF898 family)
MHDQSDTTATLPAAAQAPLTPAVDDSLAAPQPQTLAFTFTGSGREYFRIWIVNLFLSVATLGIYSAWAKVRRLQYFDRNTQLAGASFDFRGDPKAILKGRVLAVCLAALYQYAFGFSLEIGMAIVVLLMLALPFFMRSALRFRLHNTQYRGLHFDFTGSIKAAYGAYLPPLLTFLLPGALVAVDPGGKSVLYAFLLYLAWPLSYGVMKTYQQRHLQFGTVGSSYRVPPRRFFKPYLAAIGMALGAALALGIVAAIAAYFISKMAGATAQVLPGVAGVAGLVFGYAAMLMAIPYVQARTANLVWSNTSFPGLEMRSTMGAWAFIKLQTGNTLLTIFTLGLFRPFAVVRVVKYRLAHLTLHSTGSFEEVVAAAGRKSGGAAGDGMADFLGVDISW